jgi:hypothetical protein
LLDYFAIVRGVLLQQFQLAASVNDKNGSAGGAAVCLERGSEGARELLP